LQIAQSLRVDAQLAIGQQSDVMEVTTQAANIETQSETVGGTVAGEALRNAIGMEGLVDVNANTSLSRSKRIGFRKSRAWRRFSRRYATPCGVRLAGFGSSRC
jgi:hypothetical protein